ncbi:hypothetical protein [Streptomyces sp. NPDC093223]|uniref:hypothetical protein n=1 Tax=Streptomyces sp. NPDC093223 TaxID=3366033 RepID=UPI003827F864
MTDLCTSEINDGHSVVRCALEPHPDTEDHRRGFLAWDKNGRWYARRDFPDLDPADVITRALQGVGPVAEPLPGRGDRKTAALRRHLELAQKDIGKLLNTLDQPRG